MALRLPPRPASRRGRIGAAGALSLLALAALGGALAFSERGRARLAEREAWLVGVNERLGRERAALERRLEERGRELDAARLARAAALARAGEGEEARRALEALAPERRGFAWRLVGAGLPRATLAIGHGEVRAIALSADGERLLACSTRDRLTLFDTGDGAVLAEWPAHERGVNCAVFEPGGARAASAGPDRVVRVWELATQRELLALREHARPVMSLAYSADGARLAALTMGGELCVWDAASGDLLLAKDGPADGVLCVELAPDAERFAWAADGGTLRVWSARDGSKLAGLREETLGRVSELAFAPGAGLLATASRFEGSPPRVWSLERGALALELQPERAPVHALTFAPSEPLAAAALADGRVQLFELDSGRELLVLDGAPGEPAALVFGPDAARLYVGGPGALVQVWCADETDPLLAAEGAR